MVLDSNKMGTQKTTTISTPSTIDKYTQLASSSDKGRHRHISGNPDNPGNHMIINTSTTGDRDGYIQVDCASDTSSHNHFSRGHNTGNNQLIYSHPPHTNEIYRRILS
jgi:hypothetical protein